MSRITYKSVTCFLHCGDDYLFIHRYAKPDKVDSGRLNGVGGKLDPGENYLQAALREVKEETGYIVDPIDCRLAVIANLSGGYPDDWVMCFFMIEVADKHTPIGNHNNEGELVWLHKDELLTSQYELVDDLHYLWKPMTETDELIFAAMEADEDEKIKSIQLSSLSPVSLQHLYSGYDD